ncbi:MAG TPA: CoB--CoM heterodisulfide reductase iron-sulfur subunit B family protein, partial [Thermoleophilia bacterium]|nr:CoB--CoM heterodisulfide reductase iron-sulfur subunit B family protein [Thermoleophilia bacterium]
MSVVEAVRVDEDLTTGAIETRTWAYYPGCSLESSSKDFDRSSRAVLAALGVELAELDGWTCCGGSSAHQVDHTLGGALPARNLRLAEELGLDLVMPCPACSARHIAANAELAIPAKAERINAVLDRPAAGTSRVLNILEALDEVTRELPEDTLPKRVDLKVVPYYGCLLTRPGGGVEYDNAEDPVTMDRLAELAGATVLPWSFKTECCGASLSFFEKDAVLVNSVKLLDMAVQAGAQAIVTACPLCHQNLDLRQGQLEKRAGKTYGMPVYYITELIGLALGFTPEELGVQLHAVDALGLLRGAVKSPQDMVQPEEVKRPKKVAKPVKDGDEAQATAPAD